MRGEEPASNAKQPIAPDATKQRPVEEEEEASPTAAPAPKITNAPIDPHDIVKLDKPFRKPRIKLPTEAPPTQNPDYMQKDKIFGDAPVIGPKDPFANF